MYPSGNILHTTLQYNTEARRWTWVQSTDLVQISHVLICIRGGSFVCASFCKYSFECLGLSLSFHAILPQLWIREPTTSIKIQNSSIITKELSLAATSSQLHFTLPHPSHAELLTTIDLTFIFVIICLRMLEKQNHKVCNLLRLTFFFYCIIAWRMYDQP